jgi:hypothetical protein
LENCFGYWEKATRGSWKTHCEAVPEDRNQTVTWLLNCHLALRFPKKRASFQSTIAGALNGHVAQWKAMNALARNPIHQHPAYYQNPDPVFYFRHTEVPGLTAQQRKSLEAALLESHAFYVDTAAQDLSGSIQTLTRAFDAVAQEFQNANLLSDMAVDQEIPRLIVDASACGRWRYPNTWFKRTEVLTQEFGRVWINPKDLASFFKLLNGRMAYWRAQAIRKQATPSLGAVRTVSKRQRGYAAQADDHAKVVEALAPFGEEWRLHLPDICENLVKSRADFPKSMKTQSILSWRNLADQVRKPRSSAEREKLTKYLAYRVTWTRKNRKD